MRATMVSLVALLASAGILLAGGGLQGTLIAVRGDLEGFPLEVIGLFMSAYYAGFIAGCLATPRMVARAGHIRAFTALCAIAAAAVLIHALSTDPYLWLALRVVTGVSFAGLYMIVESWINEKATNENRGKVLAVYRMVDLVALTAGQFLLLLASPAGFELFSLVAILICISIVPIAMTSASAPRPIAQTSLNLRRLLSVSPLACAGVFAVGLANGAFWGIAPVFVKELGHGDAMVANFMSIAIVFGALAQWPIGALSDVIDRRRVLIAVSLFAAASGVFLFTLSAQSALLMLAGGAFYGAFAMPVFGLSAAHANDHGGEEDFVAISGGLLLVYGVGAIFGPVVAPIAMTMASPPALFAYTATIHLLLFGFGAYRMTRRPSVPKSEQGDYVAVPRTTPAVFEIDPRSGGHDEGEATPA